MARGRGRRRPVPYRTCVTCRAIRPKRELVRIVRTPEGEVVVDERGKQNGRGAYLCRQQVCWDVKQMRRRLGAALRVTLGDETLEVLQQYARKLPERLETADAS